MKIILGSQSPRRHEILSYFALPFTQVSSNFDEESQPYSGDPKKHALHLSQKKAEAIAQNYPHDVILTADTTVSIEGKMLNKPADEKEAFAFLSLLAGRWQSVFTGVTVRRGDKVFSDVEETKMLFHKLTPEQIRAFHKHCYFLDKAGGYAIEKSGSLIVERIEGCYYNVMGLPINTTARLLKKVGIDLWDHLKSF
ncbi:MAG: septum formation protein Maf [Verrucomicrobia bacterium]|nr:septum formation protein Maf [Verrucomicrobiota bacterium]